MLRDLNILVTPIKEKLDSFAGLDCSLPANFKKLVRRINNDSIQFGRNSSVVTNTFGQHIYLSNNWFYIAAALAPLYKPFEEYRRVVNTVVGKDILKSKDKDAIEKKIRQSSYSDEDKELLIKFSTDYEWWTAGATKDGKSLDRNDCLVSAVLAIANVVNNSASYIANLWNYFGDYPDIANLLNEKLDTMIVQKQTCIACSKVSEFILQSMTFLQAVDRLRAFKPFVSESKARNAEADATIIKLQSDEFPETLVGFFIETDLADIKRRNTTSSAARWFEQEFNFDGRKVFLSNQWNADGQHQLTFPEFKKFVYEAYKGRFVADRTADGMFVLIEFIDPQNRINNQVMLPKFESKYPFQQIFFGAPGTSKSTRIKRDVGDMEQHRVTFHPDTDYASFVGCYKPTQEEDGGEITYKFVPQPFIKAYVSAWKKLFDADETEKEVFLVIEEINRGNCAQIFGDLFQLLDRNDKGYSDYTIEPDSDLSRYLNEEFKDSEITHQGIKSGSVMMLPPNLYIWATMNTSDQSLFPIDSAFKRRWDWKYTPIKNAKKGHMIQLKDRQYDWWEFLEAVNKRIEKVTESEDKQMGYWFAKPDNGVNISSEKFVSKVVFYLWNDVFKDFGHDPNSPFVIKLDDGKKTELRFKSFFDEDGEVDENVLIQFLWGLKLETKASLKHDNDDDNDNNGSTSSPTEDKVETDKTVEHTAKTAYEALKEDASSSTVKEADPDYDDTLPEATSIDDFFN